MNSTVERVETDWEEVVERYRARSNAGRVIVLKLEFVLSGLIGAPLKGMSFGLSGLSSRSG